MFTLTPLPIATLAASCTLSALIAAPPSQVSLSTSLMSAAALKLELSWLDGGAGEGDLYKATPQAMKMEDVQKALIAFTNREPDPFMPNYEYENPWLAKKENKGKKPRPARK